MSCAVCAYDGHVEVCHIDALAAFDDLVSVGEINALSNLVALCPTHHWELDNGELDADELRAVVEAREVFPCEAT